MVSFTGLGKAIRLREEENQEISYEFGTKLDAVPVVNPTTPGTANPYPTLNPTTPQAPGTIGQTPSTPTTPYMTPINPYTNPTTPKTSPTTNPTLIPPSPVTTTTPTTPTASAGGQWCVASQSAAESTLKVALDYACGYGADCSSIQPGASCYNPNTLKDHASYAFNDYYQKNPAPTSCAFGGTATLTTKDPSKTFHQTFKPRYLNMIKKNFRLTFLCLPNRHEKLCIQCFQSYNIQINQKFCILMFPYQIYLFILALSHTHTSMDRFREARLLNRDLSLNPLLSN